MPVWFSPFMWAYFGICMVALLFGAFIKRKEFQVASFHFTLSQLLIGCVGFSYVLVGIVTVIFGSMRSNAIMGVPFLGRSFIDLGEPLITYIEARLLPGYYLIYVAGLVLIGLAFARNKIVRSET